MKALIDCDIFCYEMGRAVDADDGLPLTWPLVETRLEDKIDKILEDTKADSWQGYITGDNNFRIEVATIRPYKGTRPVPKPFWYQAVKYYLIHDRNCEVVEGYEADDAIAIASGPDTVMCSIDKDLLQIPGLHYQWKIWSRDAIGPFEITELEGLRNFYSQLLTGDITDNIPGLYNVGPKAASVLRIKQYTTELEMFQEVKLQYELRFGAYWDMFLAENGRLLWLLRSENDDWYRRQRKLSAQADRMVDMPPMHEGELSEQMDLLVV